MSKRKITRFNAEGESLNRYAKRELGECVERFGTVGATFKKSPRRLEVFHGIVQVGYSSRYLPLDSLSLAAVQELIKRAGEKLQDSKLEKALDWLYAELNKRVNS
jgi:hypothetical protein